MPDPARDHRIRHVQALAAGSARLTNREIAERLGISCGAVSYWRNAWPVLTRAEQYAQDVAEARKLHAAGVDTQEIAWRLSKAVSTIEDYLKACADNPSWRRRDDRARYLASRGRKTG